MIRHRWPIKTRGRPDLDVPLFGCPSRRIETRRHDTDNLVKVGVHSHALAQDMQIAREVSLPHAVANNNLPRKPGCVVPGIKRAAQLRLDAQQRKIIRRDNEQSHPRRLR